NIPENPAELRNSIPRDWRNRILVPVLCPPDGRAAGLRQMPGGKNDVRSTRRAGAVNARDRIGSGPWVNAKGTTIAKDVAELHGTNGLTKQTALTEKGEVNNGRGDTPNRHDILTGSKPDGTAFTDDQDHTCKNYTSSTQGTVMLGHADRMGLGDDDASKSWNSSHLSRGPDGGCSQADLRSTGGDGLLYCFAAN